ncbi:hypothetical protein [Micromonospora inyonensis]|uniref:hypothetical protein n=1 Tax=Micromonospora inyonensis TaxID=47866 RepID=UPI000AAA37C8|nr:hypothetical protein [Micromonospora inyonensis]
MLWHHTAATSSASNPHPALNIPDYFRQLRNDEEVHAAVASAGNPLVGNDRQFDLWRSIAYDGQVKAPS